MCVPKHKLVILLNVLNYVENKIWSYKQKLENTSL